MLARSPGFSISSISAAPAKTPRLAKAKRLAMRDQIADIMRAAEPTPFAAEGPSRHGIRSSLCLQGWRWAAADLAAAEIVAAALAIVGAKRPTWEQGQPSYVVDGAWRAERERCARCFRPLPEGNTLYCSALCRVANLANKQYERRGEEKLMVQRAARAAWSAKQAPLSCEWCAGSFQPRELGQRFCCRGCVQLSRKGRNHAA